MKISNISFLNYKKISKLNISIPSDNNVICFVGENGSNKSSILYTIYQLIRRHSSEASPSDETDHYRQNTNIIKQDSKDGFYYAGISIEHESNTYKCSEAAVVDHSKITNEIQSLFTASFRQSMLATSSIFLSDYNINGGNSTWDTTFEDSNDPIKSNVLLFRPTNRHEVAPYEKKSNDYTYKPETSKIIGHRRFPFKVTSGIDDAISIFLDVLLEHFIATSNSMTPSYSLHQSFIDTLKSIDSNFDKFSIGTFPIRSISCNGLPSLDALSSGQSDWLVTAFNIFIQSTDIQRNNNKKYRLPSDVPGIVFIDEIDKNFHPKMQEEFLPWLTSTFPKIQFIITTHSPYVIRSLPENSTVIKLPNGEDITDNYSYFDINEIISKVFEQNLGFSPSVQEKINEIISLVNEQQESNNDLIKEKYDFLTSKSASLHEHLRRIILTQGSANLIEVLDA
ncbi:AAA family ATPase [Aeromonas jandaei]|uniref:AAA family ATPase n=1 Tax=Aeromonas jandaei TaxID=650 RepID=UPI003A4609E2